MVYVEKRNINNGTEKSQKSVYGFKFKETPGHHKRVRSHKSLTQIIYRATTTLITILIFLPIVVAAGKNRNCPVDGSRTNWKPTGGGKEGISIGIANDRQKKKN